MNIKYQRGDEVKDILRFLEQYNTMRSLNNSVETERDPVLQRMADMQRASDYAGMMENRVNVDGDLYDLPYPSSHTGMVDVDPYPYLMDLVGSGSLIKSIVSKTPEAATKAAVRGGIPEIDAMRAKSINQFSKNMADKRMLTAQQERIAKDRLEYISERLLNEASKENMIDNIDLQSQLDDILSAAMKGEKDRVDDLIRKMIRDENEIRAIKDHVNDLTNLLSGRSGGETGQLLRDTNRDFMGMGRQSMTKYLANPSAFQGKAGYPRLTQDITAPQGRNEFGGIVKVVKK